MVLVPSPKSQVTEATVANSATWWPSSRVLPRVRVLLVVGIQNRVSALTSDRPFGGAEAIDNLGSSLMKLARTAAAATPGGPDAAAQSIVIGDHDPSAFWV